jgi:hypothetical protein
MNEAEWGQAADPSLMLLSLGGKARPRELALFAAACCDRIRAQMVDPRSVCAMAVLHRALDGAATREEIEDAARAADDAMYEAMETIGVALIGREEYDRLTRKTRTGPFSFEVTATRDPLYLGAEAAACAMWCLSKPHDATAATHSARTVSHDVAEATARSTDDDSARDRELAAHAELLRDILGNPFRPVALDPAWLSPTVLELARAADDDRLLPAGELCPSRLRILSDALEEAGCAEAGVLEHLRGPGPHARGCWVLRLLLARE